MKLLHAFALGINAGLVELTGVQQRVGQIIADQIAQPVDEVARVVDLLVQR